MTKTHKEMSNNNGPFSVAVEVPDHEYDYGKIIVSFNVPRIYFGFGAHMAYSPLPKKEHTKYAIRHAVQSFTHMIEKELLNAFRQLEAEEKL